MAILNEFHPSAESLTKAFDEARAEGKRYLFKFCNTLGGQFCIESSFYTRAGDIKEEAFAHLCRQAQETTIRGQSYGYIGYYDLSQNPPKFVSDTLDPYQQQTLNDIYDSKFPPPAKSLGDKIRERLSFR